MPSIKKLIDNLRSKHLTLSAAESCTGGYLSYLLTQTPGSSHVFKGAVVVYSLQAKQQFFSLPKTLLKTTQGVSGQVARLLAQNCRKSFKTDIAISIVGVAGPESVKNFKPGTVFIAITTSKKTIVKKFIFKGTRDMVRKQAAKQAIRLITDCKLKLNYSTPIQISAQPQVFLRDRDKHLVPQGPRASETQCFGSGESKTFEARAHT